MSRGIEEIRRNIKQMAGLPIINQPAKVLSVDKANGLCRVAFDPAGKVTENAVRLRCFNGNKGFLVYPAKDSYVMVSSIYNEPENLYVSMFSEIDAVSISHTESLAKLIDDLITAIIKLTVPTPAGPSGTPVNIAEFKEIANRFKKLII